VWISDEGHADVDGALGDRHDVHAGVAQKLFEAGAEVVVLNRELPRGLARVRDRVRRVGEDHVGQAAGQDLLDGFHLRGVAAEQPVFAHRPHVARGADDRLLLVRYRVLVRQPVARLLRPRQDRL